MCRIILTGDTHIPIDIQKLNTRNFPIGKSLTKNDFVIILGDFGLLWNYQNTGNAIKSNPQDICWSKEELYWKLWLEEKPWTTLFIDGNHENFERLNSYPTTQWNGGKVQKISDSIIHLMRGEIYTINNKKIFTFGGGRSIDRGEYTHTEYIDQGKNWWPEELPSQLEIDNAISNLEKNNFSVDYILTHALPNNYLMNLHYFEFDKLTSFLWNVHDMTKFNHWYCGHYHQDTKLNSKCTLMYHDIIELEA